jgi:hypothetical protein
MHVTDVLLFGPLKCQCPHFATRFVRSVSLQGLILPEIISTFQHRVRKEKIPITMAVQHSYFHNLPVEVLAMVFQSLRRLPHCLRSLAQTCRRVSDLIIPMLYSSIYLRTPDSCKQLAATVIRNPRLASLVRELQVHYHDARNDENHDAVLDVLLEVENLEILSLRSVPLYQVLEESSHKLLSMFVPKKSIDVECHTQYIGHRLRSCESETRDSF